MPECYRHAPPRLQAGYFTKFAQETLFYIFYSMPGDEAQLFAADELQHRGWAYHKEFKVGLPLLLSPFCPSVFSVSSLCQYLKEIHNEGNLQRTPTRLLTMGCLC